MIPAGTSTMFDGAAEDPALPSDWYGRAPVPVGVDEAFNGYVAANLVYALDRLGLLDRLEAQHAVDIDGFLDETGADGRLVRELLRGAIAFGYLTSDGAMAALTEAGREMARMRGYLTWAVGGYGDVFSHAGQLAAGQSRYGHDVTRDEGMVALGSGQNDRAFLAELLDGALADVDFESIADLGSGISARVCRVVAGRAGTRGVGVDISAPATQLAAQTILGGGLEDRVRAIQADVLDVFLRREHKDTLAGVDTVMSFFLLHDLLAEPATRQEILPRMREAFPRARTFVLADTVLRPNPDGATTLPVFSAGFELAHALMGIPLHSKDSYERLFDTAGLRIRRALPFGTPHSWLYVLDAD